MEKIRQDLRYGARLLSKHPGFTLIAVMTLALGIGASTAIFSIVNSVLLRPLPFDDADRLAVIWETNSQTDRNEVSAANFLDWQEQCGVCSHLPALSYASVNLSGGTEPERLQAVVATPSYFQALGARAHLGRAFLSEEGGVGSSPVAVLSHRLWQQRFAGDAGIVGKTIVLNGESRTVVGVMPPGFQLQFPTNRQVDLWLPRIFTESLAANRTAHFLHVFARLKPGVTIAQAQAGMKNVSGRLAERYPDSNAGASVRLVPLQEQIVGEVRRPLLVLLGAVGFVLLIACANVANLLLGRAAVRRREIAIRSALGATRLRVVRQLLTESAALSALGGAFGLLLSSWGIHLLISTSPATVPRVDEIGIDGRVLGFTLLVSLFTGIVFGLAPALQISRTDVTESLKDGGTGFVRGFRHRLRSLLVVAEIALALVLLAGAGLLMRSFWNLLDVDPGFETDRVLAMDVALPGAKYPEDDQQAAFFQQSLRRIGSLPGVVSAGAVTNLPLSGGNATTSVTVVGRPAPAPADVPQIDYRIVSADYFRALGIDLRAGREFSDHDAQGSRMVAIINESMARRFWPGEDPVGKHLTAGRTRPVTREIVGVVGDVKHERLDAGPKAELYVPYLQTPNFFMHIVVRTSIDPLDAIAAVRREIAAATSRSTISKRWTWSSPNPSRSPDSTRCCSAYSRQSQCFWPRSESTG
jgi:putative ABC transport system permease protein